VEAVRTVEQGRRLRDVLRPSGFVQLVGASGPDVRFDRGPCPRFGGRRKRGQHHQVLGRSRGGFSTKIHLKTDLDGDYLAFDLSGGEKGRRSFQCSSISVLISSARHHRRRQPPRRATARNRSSPFHTKRTPGSGPPAKVMRSSASASGSKHLSGSNNHHRYAKRCDGDNESVQRLPRHTDYVGEIPGQRKVSIGHPGQQKHKDGHRSRFRE
jgi:hypothetical protein